MMSQSFKVWKRNLSPVCVDYIVLIGNVTSTSNALLRLTQKRRLLFDDKKSSLKIQKKQKRKTVPCCQTVLRFRIFCSFLFDCLFRSPAVFRRHIEGRLRPSPGLLAQGKASLAAAPVIGDPIHQVCHQRGKDLRRFGVENDARFLGISRQLDESGIHAVQDIYDPDRFAQLHTKQCAGKLRPEVQCDGQVAVTQGPHPLKIVLGVQQIADRGVVDAARVLQDGADDLLLPGEMSQRSFRSPLTQFRTIP